MANFIFVLPVTGTFTGFFRRIRPKSVFRQLWVKKRGDCVDNGHGAQPNVSGIAIYKGATLGVANGHNFLYPTDFHRGKVNTFDENFHQTNPNGFVDPNLPAGYGPFGIRNFNGEIFVTYAKQDQKVNAQLEMSKPAAKVVVNKPESCSLREFTDSMRLIFALQT